MKSSNLVIAATAWAASVLAVPAVAQQALPSGLIPGIVAGAYVSGWCAVAHAPSSFERNGTNSVALIEIPDLGYNAGNGFVALDGQVRLTFTGGTSGTVKYKILGASATGTFDTYSQTYNGEQYTVTFNLTLPNGCKLPIAGYYEVAP